MRHALSLLFFFAVLSIASHVADAQTSQPDFAAVTGAIKDLCGGKGTSSDLRLKTTADGKVILPVAQGGANASVEFSKSEWDGVEAMRHDATRYTECVTKMTPLFLERMKTPTQVQGLGNKGGLIVSRYLGEADLKQKECANTYDEAHDRISENCSGRLIITGDNCTIRQAGGTYDVRHRLTGDCYQ